MEKNQLVTHREEGSPEPRCLAPENCPSELEKASRQASSAEAGFVNRTPQPTTGVEKLGSENSRDELEKRQYGENEGLDDFQLSNSQFPWSPLDASRSAAITRGKWRVTEDGLCLEEDHLYSPDGELPNNEDFSASSAEWAPEGFWVQKPQPHHTRIQQHSDSPSRQQRLHIPKPPAPMPPAWDFKPHKSPKAKSPQSPQTPQSPSVSTQPNQTKPVWEQGQQQQPRSQKHLQFHKPEFQVQTPKPLQKNKARQVPQIRYPWQGSPSNPQFLTQYYPPDQPQSPSQSHQQHGPQQLDLCFTQQGNRSPSPPPQNLAGSQPQLPPHQQAEACRPQQAEACRPQQGDQSPYTHHLSPQNSFDCQTQPPQQPPCPPQQAVAYRPSHLGSQSPSPHHLSPQNSFGQPHQPPHYQHPASPLQQGNQSPSPHHPLSPQHSFGIQTQPSPQPTCQHPQPEALQQPQQLPLAQTQPTIQYPQPASIPPFGQPSPPFEAAPHPLYQQPNYYPHAYSPCSCSSYRYRELAYPRQASPLLVQEHHTSPFVLESYQPRRVKTRSHYNTPYSRDSFRHMHFCRSVSCDEALLRRKYSPKITHSPPPGNSQHYSPIASRYPFSEHSYCSIYTRCCCADHAQPKLPPHHQWEWREASIKKK